MTVNLDYKSALGMLVGILLVLTACHSAKEKIQAEMETLSVPNSSLIYEYTDTYSGATGSCAGTFTDRWYGSETKYNDLVKMYENQLLEESWVLWPEDVVRIWRKESPSGLYSIYMQMLTNQHTSNPRGHYKLPEYFWLEADNYSTVYVISTKYMDTIHAKRCFGKFLKTN